MLLSTINGKVIDENCSKDWTRKVIMSHAISSDKQKANVTVVRTEVLLLE